MHEWLDLESCHSHRNHRLRWDCIPNWGAQHSIGVEVVESIQWFLEINGEDDETHGDKEGLATLKMMLLWYMRMNGKRNHIKIGRWIELWTKIRIKKKGWIWYNTEKRGKMTLRRKRSTGRKRNKRVKRKEGFEKKEIHRKKVGAFL